MMSALNRGVSGLMVLEEDAVYRDNFKQRYSQFASELPADAGLCYLGGQHLHWIRALPTPVSRHVYRPYCLNRLHGYLILEPRFLGKILHHLYSPESWSEPHHIDHRMGTLMRTGTPGIYCPDEWMIGQTAGKSRVSGKLLPERFFIDSRSLADVSPPSQVVAIINPRGSLSQKHLRILDSLEITLGHPATEAHSEEHMSIQDTILWTYLDQFLPSSNANLSCGWHEIEGALQRWASVRALQITGKYLGAWDVRLALLPDLVASAWPGVKFLFISDSSFRKRDSGQFKEAVRLVQLAKAPMRVLNLDENQAGELEAVAKWLSE
ncbi:hypothetical protein [Rhodopirellula bahusiensis]|uniref:hypothetical protein n=1 Tax=Rhodopirellula bahusiensis TaxID=2014065 RepID=UPI003266333E